MYFYDWSWQLLKEPLLPIREIMCVCIQEIVCKKKKKKQKNLKAVYISNEDFFFLTNKLGKLMQNNWNLDRSSKWDSSELRIFEMPLKWQLRNSRTWKIRTAGDSYLRLWT